MRGGRRWPRRWMVTSLYPDTGGKYARENGGAGGGSGRRSGLRSGALRKMALEQPWRDLGMGGERGEWAVPREKECSAIGYQNAIIAS